MRDSVVVAFASREIATLGEFGRFRPEIHVGVDALGMAALAGLRTIVSHGSVRPTSAANAFYLMRRHCTRFMAKRGCDFTFRPGLALPVHT